MYSEAFEMKKMMKQFSLTTTDFKSTYSLPSLLSLVFSLPSIPSILIGYNIKMNYLFLLNAEFIKLMLLKKDKLNL